MDNDIVQITMDTPREEVVRIGNLIGDKLKDKIKSKDYAHACSDLIHIQIIQMLSEISTRLGRPMSEMKDSRKYAQWWLNGRPTVEATMHALEHWIDIDINAALKAPIVQQKNLETLPEDIATNFYLFCMFAVWYGAKSDCKRIILNNKATNTLQKAIKTMGVNGILNRLWVSCISYMSCCEKIFEPSWEMYISGKEKRSIREIAATDKVDVKKERNGDKSVNSFAALSSLIKK
jgi:hypothetical protein